MKRRSGGSILSCRIDHREISYTAVIQRWHSNETTYDVVHVRDQTNQQWLPIFDLAKAHVRQRGTLVGMTLRSKWAARRRAKQYVRLWAEQQPGGESAIAGEIVANGKRAVSE
jgi:hypothetical protein